MILKKNRDLMIQLYRYIVGGIFLLFVVLSHQVIAQTLPSTADPGRIEPFKDIVIPNEIPKKSIRPNVYSKMVIPKNAEKTKIFLKKINLQGVRAFEQKDLGFIYESYLNHEITLDKVWIIAEKITQYYQNAGYFLSRAYIPQQEINDGIITIHIIEGYISDVAIDDKKTERYALIQALITSLKRHQPINAIDIESFMLQINALPGQEFRALVKPMENGNAGETQLSLSSIPETGQISVSFDNYGSGFLGPYQTMLTYRDSFLPFQQTTLSAMTSIPTKELRYAAVGHEIHFAPNWKVDFSGSYITSRPGASLKSSNIESVSTQLGIGLHYQLIRLRQENLTFSLGLSGKNTNGDILKDNPLTRDRIRKLKGNMNYDTSDGWYGYNYIRFGVKQGIKALGASKAGALNLSRAEADPEFTTAQFDYIRQQGISNDVIAIAHISGQLASDPLFSSEEFGYGGQSFGRAYDPSEITGDHGLAGSLELRYLGIPSWHELHFTPYGFYDIGRVWNEDSDGIIESASSFGLGMRLNHQSGFSGNLGIAFPLIRNIDNPISSGHEKNPRILFQLGYSL